MRQRQRSASARAQRESGRAMAPRRGEGRADMDWLVGSEEGRHVPGVRPGRGGWKEGVERGGATESLSFLPPTSHRVLFWSQDSRHHGRPWAAAGPTHPVGRVLSDVSTGCVGYGAVWWWHGREVGRGAEHERRRARPSTPALPAAACPRPPGSRKWGVGDAGRCVCVCVTCLCACLCFVHMSWLGAAMVEER